MNKNFITWLLIAIIPICVFSAEPEQKQKKDIQEVFFAGVNLFQQGRYQEAIFAFKSFFEQEKELSLVQCEQGENPKTASLQTMEGYKISELYQQAANLYPMALWYCGYQEESLSSFNSFYKKELLNLQGLKNYTLAALKTKNYNRALELATESSSWYVAALAAFGLENWSTAEAFFQKALTESHDTSFPMEDFYLHYYLGLAQFRQGHWDVAFATLESLYADYPSHSLSWIAAQVAIHCATQLYYQEKSYSWWEKGIVLAEKLVASTAGGSSVEQGRDLRQLHLQAVLLTSGLYRDGGQNTKALALLHPYRRGQEEEALSCSLLTAEIYTSEGMFQEALNEYQYLEQVADKEGDLAQMAIYRQGEILYSLEDYLAAAKAFSLYRSTYPSGTYSEAALYFNGEALGKGGFLDQAILCHETMVQQFPTSSFVFPSKISLVDLYRTKGEYQQALHHGNQLLASHPEQARAAGIEGRVVELGLLEQGISSEKAALLSRYQMVGGSGTGEGRRLGVELAKLYLESSGEEALAESLLEAIFAAMGIGTSEDFDQKLERLETLIPRGEEETAAQGFFLLAHIHRQKEGYRQAAQLFLQAAQLYLIAGDTDFFQDSAAAALYRGAESFDVAGMKGDSRAVAQQLASLFPQSTWTQAAQIFL